MKEISESVICVLGLGYVGLPLALEFGKKQSTIGFDINRERIAELKKGNDATRECSADQLLESRVLFTCDERNIAEADIYIVTAPTPIDRYKRPDLEPLISACRSIGQFLKPGNLVIFESTVYPGATEEDCVPVLEECSGLTFNKDFFCGFSPERINPGDKTHTLAKIRKITSGSTPETALRVDELYRSIIEAGTYKASSIRVAEAAKVIENAQRDINIAFVNELAMIFNKLGIDTQEVLEAAGTKWNFLSFRPGLVGGHCIGVDPYYLTHKAQEVGYHPEILLAGRRINDNMGAYVVKEVIKLMIKNGIRIEDSRVLILGITFKENCPDIRNTRVIDIIRELSEFGCRVDVYDPWASPAEVEKEYRIRLMEKPCTGSAYDSLILAVPHSDFCDLNPEEFIQPGGIIFDIKSFFDKSKVNGRL